MQLKQKIGFLALASLVLLFVFHNGIFPRVSDYLYQKSPAQGLQAAGEYKNLTLLSFIDERLFFVLILLTIILSLFGLRKNQLITSKYVALMSLLLLGAYLWTLYPPMFFLGPF